jgi:hypothetical protein
VAALGALAALLPALVLFDFTVDDALIPARYATHIARGLGYRFNAEGPITDGVTPLGFPYLLAPFAKAGPLAALGAAKCMGLAAWTLAAALLSVAVDRCADRPARLLPLLMVPLSAPLAGWSVAGLETGIVTALVAAAVALASMGRPRIGALGMGMGAALRPELAVFAMVASQAPAPGEGAVALPARAGRAALSLGPTMAVVAIRLAVFGRPAPLSVLAKPADEGLGFNYAVACFLLTGPLLLVAPWAIRRAGPFAQVLALAVLMHFAAVAVAGGDWMPLSRLVVPVLPAVILAGAFIAAAAAVPATAVRVALVLAGELFVDVKRGPAAAGVGATRARLVEEMRPMLEGAKVVAALDVGWVGAATDATLVDLAGLTDPVIATLPGGHTTKHIPKALIDARGVDAIVLLRAPEEPVRMPWVETLFARGVENRIARSPGTEAAFAVRGSSRVPGLPYVVVRRDGTVYGR